MYYHSAYLSVHQGRCCPLDHQVPVNVSGRLALSQVRQFLAVADHQGRRLSDSPSKYAQNVKKTLFLTYFFFPVQRAQTQRWLVHPFERRENAHEKILRRGG